MGENNCYLITILYNGTILQCALKVHLSQLTTFCRDYPLEPENRAELHTLLPAHVRSCGPIVDVKEIFEIEIKD